MIDQKVGDVLDGPLAGHQKENQICLGAHRLGNGTVVNLVPSNYSNQNELSTTSPFFAICLVLLKCQL